MIFDQLPPHNTDAERRLLGGLFRDPEVFDAVQVIVRTDDFYQHSHQRIFAAIVDLVTARKPIDLALVHEELRRRKEIDDIGGVPYLVDLWEAEPTGASAEYHAKLVRDAALVRRLIHTANEILRDAYDRTSEAEELIAQAERRILAIGESASSGDTIRVAADFLRDGLERIDQRIANGTQLGGLATGYAALDDLLGGMRPAELIVLAARPSVGKTALALNILSNVATEGTPVLFFSLEQPEADIADRLLSMGSGVPMSRFTRASTITSADAEALAGAAGPDSLGGCAIYLDDLSDQPAARIAAVCRRAVRQKGIQLVVVDYLQLMRHENPRDNRNIQVGTLALRMKNLARECGVPIILLSQLNREVENRGNGRPKLSDLRDSGDIEAHADRVILLHRTSDKPTEHDVLAIDVIVAKNRNGPIGDVTLDYRKAVLRFEKSTW